MESQSDIKRFEMEKHMKSLETKIDRILDLMEESKKVEARLGTHIDFIEKTYEQLYTPLDYVKKSIMGLVGQSSSSLEHVPSK